MEPPGERRSKPQKRDWIKAFFKDPFGSGTPSPSLSCTTSNPAVSGGPGTSSQTFHDFPISNPLAENTTPIEIQRHQNSISTPIRSQLPQDFSRQTILSASSEAIPSLTAQNKEDTYLLPISTFHHDAASQASHPFSPNGHLARSRGEEESQVITAQVKHPSKALDTAVALGNPSNFSNSAAAGRSHAANLPQQSSVHAEHQSPLEGEIYEAVKATLQRIIEVLDVFPPLKSMAAGLLVIFDTIDAYGENKKEFDALLKRVEVLSRIMGSCPPDISQEVKDRFSGLSRAMEEKKNILQDKVDADRSRAERVMLAPQDKQTVLKLTQEITFAIEIAMFDATFEGGAQTLQVVSGVSWLKERTTIIEDHAGAKRNIESTVRSSKTFKPTASNILCNSSNFSIGENATFNSIGGDMHIHKNTTVHTSLTEKTVVKDALREVLYERNVEGRIYRG